MPSNKFTPTDQTATANSTDGANSPDTDDALLSYPAGGAENISVSVTARYQGDDDGSAIIPRSRVYYSFDGAAYTLIREVSGALYDEIHTDVVVVGTGSLADFRVQAHTICGAAAGAPVPFAQSDITAWFVTYDTPGMIAEG